jgi:hypothetical protein
MVTITTIKRTSLLGALALFWLSVVSCSCPSTPSITSISPNSAPAGGAGFVLTINGKNFNSKSIAVWNGAALTISLISSDQLTAEIPATDITQPETAYVYVYNPGSTNETTTVGTVEATNSASCSVASSRPAAFTVSP